MTEPMSLTDEQLDELISKLANSLGLVFDTEPIEVF